MALQACVAFCKEMRSPEQGLHTGDVLPPAGLSETSVTAAPGHCQGHLATIFRSTSELSPPLSPRLVTPLPCFQQRDRARRRRRGSWTSFARSSRSRTRADATPRASCRSQRSWRHCACAPANCSMPLAGSTDQTEVAAMCAAAALSSCAELDERQESKIAKEE